MNHVTQPQRTASVTAGVGLAVMAFLAAFGVFGAVGALFTPGDAAKTAADIAGSQTLFRRGIASLILVAVLDIVAGALFTLFANVDRSVSLMAAGFRVAYAAVYLVAIIQLVVALGQLSEPVQALRAIDAYNTIWHVGLILFGVHLLLIGYLAYQSGFMAKVFGILLAVAGLGYLDDEFVLVLVPRPAISIGQFTFVGEVALIFWLLIKGSRKNFSQDGTPEGRHLEPDFLGTAPVQ